MVLVCFFVDFVLDSWFQSSGFLVFTSPSEFLYLFHLFKPLSPIRFGFFFSPHKLLSPIRVFIRLPLLYALLEIRGKAGFLLLRLALTSPRGCFSFGSLDDSHIERGNLLFPSWVFGVILFY